MDNEILNRYVKFESKAKVLAIGNLIAAICFGVSCVMFAYQGHIASSVSSLAASVSFMNFFRFSSDYRIKLEIIKELQSIKQAVKN